MSLQKFAITVDYPDELCAADVRDWLASALSGAAPAHRLVVESVGSHCYGYVLKGFIEVTGACAVSEEALKLLLAAPSGRDPKLTSLRLL